MELFVAAFVFLFGLIIGSFLNVVIYRYNTGLGIGGRSRCLSCGRTLGFSDLVPVFSYVFMRGRCRTCRAPVSLQYPLVELLTGFLFVGIYYSFGLNLNGAIIAVISALCIALGVYDLKHKIIPDGLVYAFILLSLGFYLLNTPVASLFGINLFTGTLAGPFVALPFALFWLISHGRWMGFGDAKLALGIGWLLGLSQGFTAVIFAFWIGAVVSVSIIVVQKLWGTLRLSHNHSKLTIKSEIPFAPFLLIGMFIELFFHLNILEVTNIFFSFFSR